MNLKEINRNFLKIMTGRFLLLFGLQAQSVLMGWKMYDLTHDPLYLGLLGLVGAIPALGMALFSGLIVDRNNPLRVMMGMVFLCFISLILAWMANTPHMLFLAVALMGFARSFFSPTMGSLVPRLVSRDEIRRSSAYSSTMHQFAQVAGPAMAGMLLGVMGYDLPYLIAFISVIASLLVFTQIKYNHVEYATHTHHKAHGPLLRELMVGVHYVRKEKLLISAMSLDMFAVLFGGVTALLPIFAAEVLHVGPSGLGWLRAAPAVGAMLMGSYLIRKPIGKHGGLSLFFAVLGFGLCILAFAVSTSYTLSLVVLAISGALDSISMVVRGSIVQLISPEHMRGRIASVNSIFIGSSNEVGEFESGMAAKLMGLIPSVIFGGVMTLVTVGSVFGCVPELFKLDLKELENKKK